MQLYLFYRGRVHETRRRFTFPSLRSLSCRSNFLIVIGWKKLGVERSLGISWKTDRKKLDLEDWSTDHGRINSLEELLRAPAPLKTFLFDLVKRYLPV